MRMVNVFIGMLIWQAIVTIIVALGKERLAARVGCGLWYIVISFVLAMISFIKFKKKG